MMRRYLGNKKSILLLNTPNWLIVHAKMISPATDSFRP
jgi:hypothetical protein